MPYYATWHIHSLDRRGWSHEQDRYRTCDKTVMVYLHVKKVKLSLFLTKHYVMKTYGGVDV
jgi:hypothetical protein